MKTKLKPDNKKGIKMAIAWLKQAKRDAIGKLDQKKADKIGEKITGLEELLEEINKKIKADSENE